MSTIPSVELLISPEECDPQGHLSHTALLRFFERARWEALEQGPGMTVFSRSKVWPVVRKLSLNAYKTASVGEVLRFDVSRSDHGTTGLTLHQAARRVTDDMLLAEETIELECVDADGNVVALPEGVAQFYGVQRAVRRGSRQQLAVRGLATSVDVQGDGTAILFIHGFPFDRTMWRHQLSMLTGWRRIAPDLRGMGLTDGPPTEYSMAEYADDIAALLDSLHQDEAVVCGLSMGGYVAFEMLRRHADRVLALVLVNTRADADSPADKKTRNEMIDLVKREGPAALAGVLVPKMLAPVSHATMPQVVDELKEMINGGSPEGIVGALAAMRDRPDSTDLLESISVPTLVIAGAHDQIVSVSVARKMAQAVPGAQFTVMPDAGHLAPLEQPTSVSRVLAEFLESVT